MASKVLIKRGHSDDLPDLDYGEFGYCYDKAELYIGGSSNGSANGGNVKIGANIDDIESSITDVKKSAITNIATNSPGTTSGNYTITYTKNNATTTESLTIDSKLDTTSYNAVQNKVIAAKVNDLTTDIETAQSTADDALTTAQDAQNVGATALALAWAADRAADRAALAGVSHDGKIYGVKFANYGTGTSPLGTRTQAAEGLTAAASTDTTAATNDFDSIPLFQSVAVNGYLDEDYEFVETAVEGDANFALDGSNGDVYMRFQLRFFRYLFEDGYEEIQLTDTFRPNEGWCPYGAFLKADGSLRPYIYVAKYEMGYQESTDDEGNTVGYAASISGVCPAYNTYANMAKGTTTAGISHNTQITIMTAKGSQYCGMTEKEIAVLADQFDVEFATRNSQSIMYGCASYNKQALVAYAEEGVERVLLSSTDGTYYAVGSCISVSESGLTAAPDRGSATAHTTVHRKLITKIEEETIDDTTYYAIYIDNGGVTFDTATDMYVTTMPWYTGACDSVLGTSGSPVSNTSGKYPMMYRGVENFYGNLYTIISDTVVSDYVPYTCYDNTLFTSAAPTTDYLAANYTVSESNGYIVETGYDESCPEIRYPTNTTGGGSSTYFCDYWYISSGIREVLFGGCLLSGTNAGLRFRHANSALSIASWHRAARISTCGSCYNPVAA